MKSEDIKIKYDLAEKYYENQEFRKASRLFEQIKPKYNTDSQGTGSVNNILDVYPWLQSYLGAYMLGGAGSFQMRVVRG